MWTQRDQIQAYGFLRRRLISALILGDANAPSSPSRRTVLATTLGLVLLVLLLAGFGILAVVKPGAPSDWRQGGAVIVEKETGTRFVLGADGKAHPVLNYASARLLAGGNGAKTVSVAAATLATVPRGLPLGIPDAPDSLPATDTLDTGPWSACSQVAAGAPVGATPTTTAILGPLAAGPVLLGGSDALVVRDPSTARYLVTGGTRYALGEDAAVALGLGTAQDVPVSTAFVSAVPVGRPLAVIPVAGAGLPGPTVGGRPTLVGQVLQTDNVGAGARFFVVRSDGLAAVTELEAALVLGAPANRVAYGAAQPAPLAVASADALGAPKSAAGLPQPPSPDGSNGASAYPETVPTVRPLTDDLTAGFVVCVSSAGQGRSVVVAGPRLPLPAGAEPVADRAVRRPAPRRRGLRRPGPRAGGGECRRARRPGGHDVPRHRPGREVPRRLEGSPVGTGVCVGAGGRGDVVAAGAAADRPRPVPGGGPDGGRGGRRRADPDRLRRPAGVGPAVRVTVGVRRRRTPSALTLGHRAVGEGELSVATVTVRRLSADDWAVYRRVRLAALAESPACSGPPPLASRRSTRRTGATRAAGSTVALDGAEPLGVVGWHWTDPPAVADLVAMWVSPAARGRGVGAALVRDVVDQVVTVHGATLELGVLVDNAVATELYRREGFVDIGREVGVRSGDLLRRMRYAPGADPASGSGERMNTGTDPQLPDPGRGGRGPPAVPGRRRRCARQHRGFRARRRRRVGRAVRRVRAAARQCRRPRPQPARASTTPPRCSRSTAWDTACWWCRPRPGRSRCWARSRPARAGT